MQQSVIDTALTDTDKLQSTEDLLEVAALAGTVSGQASVISDKHQVGKTRCITI